jgi:hypothetical protein
LADYFVFGESCTSICLVVVFAVLIVNLINVRVLMLSQLLEQRVNWRVAVYVPERTLTYLYSLADSELELIQSNARVLVLITCTYGKGIDDKCADQSDSAGD